MEEKVLQGEFILNSKDKKEELPVKHHSEKKSSPEKSAAHFYSSFSLNPQGVSFSEQEEKEQIVLLLRRHFITNTPWLFLSFILLILPLLFPLITSIIPLPAIKQSYVGLLLSFYYLFIFGFVLSNFALWYFHVGLVTNLRLVDIDLSGILYRQVTAINHESIEDVTYTQTGFISSLFNYGNVHIQTAGNVANVEFDHVPFPAKVADVISDFSKSL